MRTTPSRSRAARALATVAALATMLLPAAAQAATSFPDPGGTGASVTLDTTTIAPGETLHITGDGFKATSGGSGDPLVTLRPYDFDRGPAWTAGGADHYTTVGDHSSEAAYWFRTHQPSGTFAATMQLPATAEVDGPEGGLNGNHWLRVLTGAFFTSTGDRLTDPISYQVPFKVVENVTLGLTFAPASAFQEGTTFRPGAAVTLRGRGFAPSSTVSVQLDGTLVPTTSPSPIPTDADGATPANATFTIPAGTAPGAHTIRVASGAIAHEVAITVRPQPTRTLLTPKVRPGGTIAVSVEDYVGVGGKGQKVGIVIGSTVLTCLSADDTGSATGTATLPADTQAGNVTLLYNAGTSCIPPPAGGVVNDQPISSLGTTPPLVAATDAPTVTIPGGPQSKVVTVTGEGFDPGTATASYRGAALDSSLSVDAAGRLTGTVTLPSAVGSGPVLVTSGTTTAASAVSVSERPAPPADPTPTTPVTPVSPDVPTAPLLPTVPITPTAPVKPVVVPGKADSLKARPGNRKVRFVLKGGSAVSTAVTIRSKSKVRLSGKRKAKAKIVVLAKRTLSRAGTYDLTLTKDGRTLLRRTTSVKVVVTVAPKGGKARTRTLTLKRA